MPRGWVVRVTHRETSVCVAGVSPRDWREMAETSRWPEPDDAIEITVTQNETLDDAAHRAGFFRGEDGKLWASQRGADFRVARAHYGGMRGYEASGFYRGYAKDGANLGHQSRLYSGTYHTILLQRRARSFVIIEFHEWSPDIHVDRVKAASIILRSLRPESAPH